MSKKVKARELFLANPGISNGDFVKMLMDQLGMTLQGARTYSYNARNESGTPVAPKAKAKAASKRVVAKTTSKKIEKSIEDVATTKAKNLAKMKEISKKLKPFREQLDDTLRDSCPDFDPQLAREEVQAILEGEGFLAGFKPGKTHD
jgi:hypothetical protein